MHRHVEVYLDESGDLGQSARSSRHVVAAALSVSDPVGLRRLVRKANRRFGPARGHLSELKFNEASESLRRFVLEGIGCTDARIAWAAACKPLLSYPMRVDKGWLVTYLSACVVSGISTTCSARAVSVVVDRRRIKEKTRYEFDRRIIAAITGSHAGFFPPSVGVTHMDSQMSEGLQAADFVAGAVFQRLERGRSHYLDIVTPRVVSGRMM